MRLKSLGVRYFMSFGDWQEIHFNEEQQIVSIIGEWADEPKRSNRSGKSTFVEAIIYGLYGKSRSKKEIDLINKNFPDEDMLVKLVFETDQGEEIIIQRGRTSSNQIILELTGFEGADKKVIQEEIDKLVGLNYNDFIMTSFFLQGDIHTFMEAGPTGQKQVIAKWLEKEYWKEFEKKTKEKQQEIQKEIDKMYIIAEDKPDVARDGEIKNDISYLENKRSILEEALATLNGQLEDINNQIKKADEIVELERDIKKIERNITSYQAEIDRLNLKIKKLMEKMPEAEKRDKALRKLGQLSKQLSQMADALEEKDEEVSKKRDEHSLKKAEVNNLRSQYKEMNKFDNICPVMKKACAAIDSIEGAKEELIEKGKVAAKELEQLQGDLELLRAERKKLAEHYNEVLAKYNEVKAYEKLPGVKDLNENIEAYQEEIEMKKEQIKQVIEDRNEKIAKLQELEKIDIDKLKNQKREIKTEISVKNDELNDIINNVAALNAELKQNIEKRKRAIQAEKEIKVLTEKLNQYKMVAFMFSKNGIPSNQVEVAFNEIEEETNIILEKVNSDISIEFSPDRELKTWEENCLVCNTPFPKGYRKIECPECGAERQKKRKDELNIVIKTQSKEIDFNLESGGGKVLISLAIRLAFVRMLQRRLGVNLKLIVLDELFGMLDEINRANVFKLLTDTLINDFGFSQIFCISHEEEIKEAIPNVIKVTKYEEYSVFGWE